MLILGAVGLQIRLSDWFCSLAKQERSARPLVACKARIFFPAKIQQTGRSNLTFRSFRFFSFDKS